MMGEIDGVICSTVKSRSAGSSERLEPMWFQTSSVAWCMSVPGVHVMDNSDPPRMVLERTSETPMTVATASSSGRVTFRSIVVRSRLGTLATTAMRGNVTSG